jgi:hypothetical protein
MGKKPLSSDTFEFGISLISLCFTRGVYEEVSGPLSQQSTWLVESGMEGLCLWIRETGGAVKTLQFSFESLTDNGDIR